MHKSEIFIRVVLNGPKLPAIFCAADERSKLRETGGVRAESEWNEEEELIAAENEHVEECSEEEMCATHEEEISAKSRGEDGSAAPADDSSMAKAWGIISFRNENHHWDPKSQMPELWNVYNSRKNKGESIRVFPLSNWTELDIWQYIHLEKIPIVPLYFSAPRPVVERDGVLIMVDDDRIPLEEGEAPEMRNVRFRTLGCYPLTGAVESDADTLPQIIQEMLLTTTSERQGRVIDFDSTASMEKKKQEGYF